MRVNPFYNSWLFLTGETDSHLGVGGWRYLLVAIFWGLIVASIYIAYRNWQADPKQRTSSKRRDLARPRSHRGNVVRRLSLEAADPFRRVSILARAGGEICGIRRAKNTRDVGPFAEYHLSKPCRFPV